MQTASRPVRRILVVELWNIGDVILTLPFLSQIRALFPAAEITLLGQPHARTLLEGTGLVDSIVETRLTWQREQNRIRPFTYDWAELLRVVRLLRRRGFDIAFQSKLHFREHILLAASGARRRVGYFLEAGARGALTDEHVPVPDRQRVQDWLELLRPFGGPLELDPPRLSITVEEKEGADAFLQAHGIGPSATVIGVHPGASESSKRWPLEKFAEVTRPLASRPGLRILVFVEPGGYGARLANDPRIVLAQVGLRELVALIARCDLLLCNDSGPMHIAGALGVPTVALFAKGVERSFSPLGSGHRVVSPDNMPQGFDVPGPSIAHIPTAAVRAALDSALASVFQRSESRGQNLANAKPQ